MFRIKRRNIRRNKQSEITQLDEAKKTDNQNKLTNFKSSYNLKRMSRQELLELLILQSKKIDELQSELDKTNELLNSKEIMIEESGSIAEASIKLNKIFEVAQQTADQYLENVKRK